MPTSAGASRFAISWYERKAKVCFSAGLKAKKSGRSRAPGSEGAVDLGDVGASVKEASLWTKPYGWTQHRPYWPTFQHCSEPSENRVVDAVAGLAEI